MAKKAVETEAPQPIPMPDPQPMGNVDVSSLPLPSDEEFEMLVADPAHGVPVPADPSKPVFSDVVFEDTPLPQRNFLGQTLPETNTVTINETVLDEEVGPEPNQFPAVMSRTELEMQAGREALIRQR